MFLAHFSNTPLHVLEEMPGDQLHWYYNEAVKLHKKLNPAPSESP
jgi:hypothetical protein